MKGEEDKSIMRLPLVRIDLINAIIRFIVYISTRDYRKNCGSVARRAQNWVVTVLATFSMAPPKMVWFFLTQCTEFFW